MNKEEIISSLTTKANFHKSVEICLDDDIDIYYHLKHYIPEINVYHYKKESLWESNEFYHFDNGDNSAHWLQIDLVSINFKIVGSDKIYNGVNDFFRYYDKINTIICCDETLRIKFDKWYKSKDSDHYEISFHLHCTDKPAFENKECKEYFLDGVCLTKKEHTVKLRKDKLEKLGIEPKPIKFVEPKPKCEYQVYETSSLNTNIMYDC